LLDAADLLLLVFGAIAVAGRPGRLERLLMLLQLILELLQFLLPAFLFLTFLLGLSALALPSLSRALTGALATTLTGASAASGLAAAALASLGGHTNRQHAGNGDDAEKCDGFPHLGLQMALQS
jgi:hypothetical protein